MLGFFLGVQLKALTAERVAAVIDCQHVIEVAEVVLRAARRTARPGAHRASFSCFISCLQFAGECNAVDLADLPTVATELYPAKLLPNAGLHRV